MASSVKPPFRADHVGSLLRPENVKAARDKWLDGQLDSAELKAIEDQAIRDVVKFQEDVGLHSVTDGEFRRTSFHFDFLGQIEGVSAPMPKQFEAAAAAAAASGGTQAFVPPQLKIEGKISHARGIEVESFKFLKSVTKRHAKLTIPSPTMLLRGGRAAVNKDAYPDLEKYYEDVVKVYRAEIKALADVGCTYLQLDDTNFAYLCDSRMREQMRQRGEDPEQLPHRYVKLINAAIAERPASMAVSVHLCRGNMQGRWAAEGGYEAIADAVFSNLKVDGYFLEYESERAGGFEPLRFMPKTTKVVLGLVSSKVPEMESKDVLKQRIADAGKFMSVDQMCLSPQCGFASSYKGNPVTVEIERQKLALIVETAIDVWGSAA